MKTKYKIPIILFVIIFGIVMYLTASKPICCRVYNQMYACGDCALFLIKKSSIAEFEGKEVNVYYKNQEFEYISDKAHARNNPKQLCIASYYSSVCGTLKYNFIKLRYDLHVTKINKLTSNKLKNWPKKLYDLLK